VESVIIDSGIVRTRPRRDLGAQKLSKSLGGKQDPVEISTRYGSDALRWWFLRDAPRSGDTDFRAELLAARADTRTIGLVVRFRTQGLGAGGRPSDAAPALARLTAETPAAIGDALRRVDFRAAAGALWRLAEESNRFVATTRPWELATAEQQGNREAAAELNSTAEDASRCVPDSRA
jgi:methionyl-tRNA synthetase